MKVYDAEAEYKMLHSLGGCDAKEEWAKGYDAAIDNAISHLDNIPVIEVEMEEQMKFGTGEQTMEVEIKQLLAEKSFNIVMLTIQYNAKDLNT